MPVPTIPRAARRNLPRTLTRWVPARRPSRIRRGNGTSQPYRADCSAGLRVPALTDFFNSGGRVVRVFVRGSRAIGGQVQRRRRQRQLRLRSQALRSGAPRHRGFGSAVLSRGGSPPKVFSFCRRRVRAARRSVVCARRGGARLGERRGSLAKGPRGVIRRSQRAFAAVARVPKRAGSRALFPLVVGCSNAGPGKSKSGGAQCATDAPLPAPAPRRLFIMADEGEVSALVCDNGSGMVKVRACVRATTQPPPASHVLN